MSDTVIIAFLAALPPTLVAAAALWKVMNVHKELNSRLTEWKEETARATAASNLAFKAAGVAEEKAREK